MALAFSRKQKKTRSRKHRRSGGGMNVGVDNATGKMYPGQESSLSGILPTTTWGSWSEYPGALAWSSSAQAPPPLANGGLYTGPQSTGPWASSPFPATLHAEMIEAAKVSGLPEFVFHQRPNDNTGASFSPYVSVPLSPQHYSAQQDASGKWAGGAKKRKTHRRNNKRNRKGKGKRTRRHK